MNNDSKFSTGFLMGLILGGGLVFLIGTKTGKNLLKIISEQGMDGLFNLLEEYDIDDLIQVEEHEAEETPKSTQHAKTVSMSKETEDEEAPKRRFFKRIRR